MKRFLTDTVLRNLKSADAGKRYVLWDGGLANFGVRVTDSGVISYITQRRRPGKAQPVRVTIGRYPELSLKAARKQAGDALADLATGVDPRQRKLDEQRTKAVQEATTFSVVAEDFITRYVSSRRTARVIESIIRRELMAVWGSRPISQIRRADVVELIEEVASRSPSMARQVRVYGAKLFDWAINRGRYGIDTSPFTSVKPRDLIPRVKPRTRVLTDDEIRAIWQATDKGEYPHDPYIRLLLITACRRSELANVTTKSLDLDAGTLFISGDQAKNEQPRIVPLTAMAVAIFRSLPEHDGPHVFSNTAGKRPISGFAKIKSKLDKAIAAAGPKPLAGWRLHDLRRTARTRWSGLPISHDIRELMLGHAKPGIVSVYDLHEHEDEQRAGFEAWAAKLSAIITPATDNVVALRA